MRSGVGAARRRGRARCARGRATAARSRGGAPGRAGVPVALILILSGPPGSGKTTVARALAGRFARSAHVEADRFFDFIRGGWVEPWDPESQEQNAVVMRAVADTASTYAGAGYTTIVEGIVIPRWFLGPLRDTLEAAGHEVGYVVLRAPLELCRQRVAARGPESLSAAGALEGIWEQFQDLGPWERHAIDAATPDVQAVVAEVERRLERGELLSP